MTQDEFVAVRRGGWDDLDGLLSGAEKRRGLDGLAAQRLAALYLSLAGDLAVAESRRYGGDLVEALSRLASRAHAVLYRRRPARWRTVVRFFTHGFPQTLRRHRRLLLISTVLFGVPLLITLVASWLSPGFAERILPSATLAQVSESYGGRFGGRGDGEGAMMAGFYVFNNVGIAFRCFATGIFFGIGTVVFLVYNGVVIGTVIGYAARLGLGGNIVAFVMGHAPLELTAIVISGAAGLALGDALLRTEGLTRLASLRARAYDVAVLVMGAGCMLVVAAAVEAFWSGSSLPRVVKAVAGCLVLGSVGMYLVRGGRDERPR